jgi:hypothetical protein
MKWKRGNEMEERKRKENRSIIKNHRWIFNNKKMNNFFPMFFLKIKIKINNRIAINRKTQGRQKIKDTKQNKTKKDCCCVVWNISCVNRV